MFPAVPRPNPFRQISCPAPRAHPCLPQIRLPPRTQSKLFVPLANPRSVRISETSGTPSRSHFTIRRRIIHHRNRSSPCLPIFASAQRMPPSCAANCRSRASAIWRAHLSRRQRFAILRTRREHPPHSKILPHPHDPSKTCPLMNFSRPADRQPSRQFKKKRPPRVAR